MALYCRVYLLERDVTVDIKRRGCPAAPGDPRLYDGAARGRVNFRPRERVRCGPILISLIVRPLRSARVLQVLYVL